MYTLSQYSKLDWNLQNKTTGVMCKKCVQFGPSTKRSASRQAKTHCLIGIAMHISMSIKDGPHRYYCPRISACAHANICTRPLLPSGLFKPVLCTSSMLYGLQPCPCDPIANTHPWSSDLALGLGPEYHQGENLGRNPILKTTSLPFFSQNFCAGCFL